MSLVHQWGGLVEHPVGSSLFREHGLPKGEVIHVDQGDYGHLARKPTLLYCVFGIAGRQVDGDAVGWK